MYHSKSHLYMGNDFVSAVPVFAGMHARSSCRRWIIQGLACIWRFQPNRGAWPTSHREGRSNCSNLGTRASSLLPTATPQIELASSALASAPSSSRRIPHGDLMTLPVTAVFRRTRI